MSQSSMCFIRSGRAQLARHCFKVRRQRARFRLRLGTASEEGHGQFNVVADSRFASGRSALPRRGASA